MSDDWPPTCTVCGDNVLALTTDGTCYPCGHIYPKGSDGVDISDACIGIGPICIHCNERLPEDGPRTCEEGGGL